MKEWTLKTASLMIAASRTLNDQLLELIAQAKAGL
jgi:hypothetical protein